MTDRRPLRPARGNGQASARGVIAAVAVVLLASLAAAADLPPLQHADTYTAADSVAGWMMSEKLDGIRAVWTGNALLTRQGRTIHAPAWFVVDFPPFALDGELWRRRSDFNFVQNTVLDREPSTGWREITYNIFEVPEAPGPFGDRLDKAADWFKRHPVPFVHIIEQIVCRDSEHLDRFLSSVEAHGGEGVIVKDPRPAYHAGRTPHVLKVKTFADMEGTVVTHNPGKGKYQGMLGSLTLRLESGVEFNLGTGFSDAERRRPPPVGAVVTFKYQGFTRNGIPRFASFLHVRKD